MKSKSQFPPKSNANKGGSQPAPVDPNAGDPEDLAAMWSAVAALLDDTTVGPPPAGAPTSNATLRSTPPQSAQSLPAPVAGAPVGGAPVTGTSEVTAPAVDNAPPVVPTSPQTPGETPPTRNGSPLTPPYAPGAGPQILPAPDGYLETPPVSAEPQPVVLPRQAGEPFILPEGLDNQSVTIRGRNEGVSVEMVKGAWFDLLYVLSYRVEQTDGFFKGNHIAVDTGSRLLSEADLNQMRAVMRVYGLSPNLLRTTSERTFQAALALGIPVTQVGPDGAPMNEALPAKTEAEGLGFFVYRGSLRSGQVLYRREHIIVIGDVNPGAEVVSDGDVMVWGRLRGIAHAGARGNGNAIITALDPDPVQLRIDQVIGAAQAGISANGPRWGASRSADRKAELARLVNGKLTIQPWDEVKSGGVALLKRKFF